jgi:RimJ/RimL family protein N-acetyltransferase
MDYIPEYATIQDLEATSKVFMEVLGEIPYYNDLAKENELKKYSYVELVRKLGEDAQSVLILRDNQHIAAFCFSRFDDYTIWLEWFGVSKHHRGKQLSKYLLAKLDERARNKGCHKIWCDSRTENKESKNVLTRNGYALITRVDNHWYSQDFFLWQKILPPL